MSKSTTVAAEQFKAIPYLSSNCSLPRMVATTQFYVDGEWHTWLFLGGKLTKVDAIPVEAHYFGDQPEKSTDQCLPLLNLIAQHTLTRTHSQAFFGLWNDVQNLAAVLAKLKLYRRLSLDNNVSWNRIVATDVEYILSVCRSIFDLLQELVRLHWNDMKVNCTMPPSRLPNSFADVVCSKNSLRTSKDIQSKYGLFSPLADWYAEHGEFLQLLRSIRDRLIHRGDNLEVIFSTDRGMAVKKGTEPFVRLYEWPVGVETESGLVPIRPLICQTIQRTMNACHGFAEVLRQHVSLPEETAPGLRFYSRGYHDAELAEIPVVVSESRWCDT